MSDLTEPGQWFLWATCVGCGSGIPILEITPDAKVSGTGDYTFENVRCQICGVTSNYSITALTKGPVEHLH